METIDLEVADGLATILLNRPETLNAWNLQFGVDLLEAVSTVAGDDTVRAVCVRGGGRGFSSRADLRGMGPDGGSSLLVPSRVGFTRAVEMAMLGERVPAARAVEWGLINRVVADDAFEDEVRGLTERLAVGPTRSYAGTKRQLNTWLYSGMAQQLELEADIQQEMAAMGDFAEGMTAFIQKRAAAFRGA